MFVCVVWVGEKKREGGVGTVFQTPLSFEECCGGVLLSHTLPGAVPSALAGLASRFGMGAGRFPAAMTTTSGSTSILLCPQRVGVCVGCDPYSGLTSTLLVSVNPVRHIAVCG